MINESSPNKQSIKEEYDEKYLKYYLVCLEAYRKDPSKTNKEILNEALIQLEERFGNNYKSRINEYLWK